MSSLEDQRLSDQIEIATLPEIRRPRPADLAAALDSRLTESERHAAPNASPPSS